MSKKVKPKNCTECGTKFTPANSFIKGCSYECNVKIAVKRGLKERQRLTKERKQKDKAVIDAIKEKHKDSRFYKKVLQSVFNTFIKLRDREDGCISCGTRKDVQYAAGHFWTVGSAPALRYHEDNVHKQCNMNCNKNRSGNINEYRPALIRKIGQERFDLLESQKGIAKHYTVDELKELIAHYKNKIKEMQK